MDKGKMTQRNKQFVKFYFSRLPGVQLRGDEAEMKL
jgi:hypothetical protein